MMNARKPDTFAAKTTLHGRITIPDEYRKLWSIEDGDLVYLQILSVHKDEKELNPQ